MSKDTRLGIFAGIRFFSYCRKRNILLISRLKMSKFCAENQKTCVLMCFCMGK
jgi:hypothetical protein